MSSNNDERALIAEIRALTERLLIAANGHRTFIACSALTYALIVVLQWDRPEKDPIELAIEGLRRIRTEVLTLKGPPS